MVAHGPLEPLVLVRIQAGQPFGLSRNIWNLEMEVRRPETIKPVVLVVFERLHPGSQLVQQLEQLQYDVRTLRDASGMVPAAEQTRPLLVLVDLYSSTVDVCTCIAVLKSTPSTAHLPVVAFAQELDPTRETEAVKAGARYAVSGSALLTHLQQILDQAMEVE